MTAQKQSKFMTLTYSFSNKTTSILLWDIFKQNVHFTFINFGFQLKKIINFHAHQKAMHIHVYQQNSSQMCVCDMGGDWIYFTKVFWDKSNS